MTKAMTAHDYRKGIENRMNLTLRSMILLEQHIDLRPDLLIDTDLGKIEDALSRRVIDIIERLDARKKQVNRPPFSLSEKPK